MAKMQPNFCQSRRLKNSSVNFGNPFDKNDSSTTFNSSTESLSSDNENFLTPLLFPNLNQNRRHAQPTHRRRNIPVKTASKNKKRSSTSRLNKQKFPKHSTSSATQTMLPGGNQPSTVLYLLPSKQYDYIVHQYCGQPVYHVGSVSGNKMLPSISGSESLKFHKNSTPSHHTSVAFNDPTSHNYKTKTCICNTFQNENQLCNCLIRPSKQAVSSRTHKLISDCIRNCQTPLNVYGSLDSSTTSRKSRPNFQLLNSPVSQSTPKDYPSLEEIEHLSTVSRSISQSSTSLCPLFRISPIETSSQTTNFSSQSSTTSRSAPEELSSSEERSHSSCSIETEVGSLETVPENMTSLLSKAEPISNASPNSPIVQTTSKGSWHIQDDTKSIKQSSRCPLNSYYLSLKENFTYSKAISEKNGQNNIALKNENSSKSSSVCALQLQRDASPSSTSTFPFTLGSSKHIQNATENIGQPFPYSEILYDHPITRYSNNSSATDIFLKEKGHHTLGNNDPSLVSFLYPEESLSLHVEEPFAPPNSPNPLSSSEEERWCTQSTVGGKSQSLASLSMMCGPPSEEDSAMSMLSNEPNSEHNGHTRNKTRTKSKFASCFMACLCPSSPRQNDQT